VDIREVHNTLVWRKGKRIRVELDKQRLCRKFCSGGCEGAGRMVEKQRRASRRLSVIVAQQPTETISAHDCPALVVVLWLRSNPVVVEALMIALVMIMGQVLQDRLRQGAFSQHDHLRKGLLLDGAHKPFAGGVEMGTPRR
jgi:hypothetical protein